MWYEWEPDPEVEASGPAPTLWCDGWVVGKDALALAFFRFGFADDLGGGWRLAESHDLRHTYICTEEGQGDERTLFECDRSGADPRPVTFAMKIIDGDH